MFINYIRKWACSMIKRVEMRSQCWHAHFMIFHCVACATSSYERVELNSESTHAFHAFKLLLLLVEMLSKKEINMFSHKAIDVMWMHILFQPNEQFHFILSRVWSALLPPGFLLKSRRVKKLFIWNFFHLTESRSFNQTYTSVRG